MSLQAASKKSTTSGPAAEPFINPTADGRMIGKGAFQEIHPGNIVNYKYSWFISEYSVHTGYRLHKFVPRIGLFIYMVRSTQASIPCSAAYLPTVIRLGSTGLPSR